jgi:hypothetical protein
MRSPPNPQRRVAEVIGDCLDGIKPETAADDALALLATRNYKENFPPPVLYPPTAFERRATAHHESGHAIAAWRGGAENISLTLGANGGGLCYAGEIRKLEDRITFCLAGALAEARYYPRSIHKYTSSPCYDFTCARVFIDQLNEGGGQIHLTYRSAAKRAMVFVDSWWRSIENVALALGGPGELDDHAIRLFATCGL